MMGRFPARICIAVLRPDETRTERERVPMAGGVVPKAQNTLQCLGVFVQPSSANLLDSSCLRHLGRSGIINAFYDSFTDERAEQRSDGEPSD